MKKVFFLLSTLAHVQSFKLHLGTTAASVNAVNGSVHEGCEPIETQLTEALMKSYCGKMITNKVDRSPATKACLDADTPAVRLSLANHMFKHCGAWNLYDFHQPSTLCYYWNEQGNCFKRSSHCHHHKEKKTAVARKATLCTVGCTPVQTTLTEGVMKSYCSQLVVEGADLSPGAKGCEESDTYYVRRSLANKMFTHCGAHYLYDYDTPSAVCYEWNGSEKCWSRGTACKTHEMGQRLVARKALMCKIPMVSVPKRRCKGTPYTYNEAKGCNGWSSLTEKQCMEKCSSNARAKNCPQKTCRAAVFYKDSGWCHLYDSCEELEDFERSTHLGDKVPMSQVEGRVCSGLLPFTYNTGVGCDGWGGITQEQCAQRCVGNQRAPNCPQKICVAAVFYKSTGWCHLYDECSQLEARKSATLIVPEASTWCKGTQVEAWDCDKIEQSRCSQSFTRSKVGNYFVQCSVASNGQCLSGGGICQA